jgi:hypothetical protein
METENTPQLPAGEIAAPKKSDELTPEQKKNMIIAAIVGVVIVLLIVAGIVFLATVDDLGVVTRVRDIFIIFMALESLLIGLALVILMVQLARLINLLDNEIKPILDSTNETVSHLRGTTVFLSNNLVEPVIKLNEYLAGFTQLLQVIGLARKPSKSKPPKGE